MMISEGGIVQLHRGIVRSFCIVLILCLTSVALVGAQKDSAAATKRPSRCHLSCIRDGRVRLRVHCRKRQNAHEAAGRYPASADSAKQAAWIVTPREGDE